MKVHQWVPTLHKGDAIGSNILYLDGLMRKSGFDTAILAIEWDEDLDREVLPISMFSGVSGPEDVILYHFAIPSQLTELFKTVPGVKVLIYHNITPPEYFIGIDPEIVHIAATGRQQLESLRDYPELSLADSEYNRKELEELGFQSTGVLPLLIDRERLQRYPDNYLQKIHDNSAVNIISVGRCFPNKGFDDVIKIFYYYNKFIETHSRLFIVGKFERGEKYLGYLKELCTILKLDDVVFTGHVSDSELAAYYRLADIYLGMNLHEGFCMPLVEAMSFQVPVIARKTTAIPETMKGAGVLVNDLNYIEIAELIAEIMEHDELKSQIITGQDTVLREHYDPKILDDRFRSSMDKILWK
jgi:glycosyltransferase involved in cell wall biosynthesis